MSSTTVGAKKKQGRNESCNCGSGKKYKFCCFAKDTTPKGPRIDIFSNDQLRESSEQITTCKQWFKELYPDQKIIDISDTLNPFNYKVFQETNFEKNIIMLATKQVNNKAVFDKREALEEDMIVMFRGAYRVFAFEQLQECFESLCEMIDTRLAGLDDDGDE